jgi:hypothetical protein
MNPVRRARAIAAGVLALAALALVALAARSDRTPVLTPITRPSGSAASTVEVTPSVVSATSTPAARPEADWSLSSFVFVLLLLLAAAYLLGFWAWMLRRSRGGQRWWWLPARFRRERQPAPDPAVAGALAGAVDAGLRRIDEGEPRDAVIACWVLLERAAAAAGTARRPAETSAELTARVLAEQRVTADLLRRLADLYREARYSEHQQGEPAREQARAALRQLHHELTGQPAARSVGSG